MKIIKHNPYRIVGLLIGATEKEKQKQIKRLKMFLEAEQEPEEDFSLPLLGRLQRTIESVTDAASKLNLDSDKMSAALFWFYKGNAITDEPAIDSLKEGEQQNSTAIWTKLTASGEVTQRNSSAFHNLSTLFLCNAFNDSTINPNLLEQGILLKLKFLESDFVKDFKAVATDATYKTSKKELQLLFLNQVQYEVEKNGITSNMFLEILSQQEFCAKEDFLKGFVLKPIEQIEKGIEMAKTKRKANKADAANVGKELYEQTADNLFQLKTILGTSNIKFSSISDKVSDEILQSGIDYFLHYRDSNTDPGSTSMDLFLKAKSLAIGNIAKQRCQENTENLQEWIEDKPERDLFQKAGKQIEFIVSKMNIANDILNNDGFSTMKNTIYYKIQQDEKYKLKARFDCNSHVYFLLIVADDTLKACISKLIEIKNSLGSSNEMYLNLSSNLANLLMSCLIKYINKNATRLGLNTIPHSITEKEIELMKGIGNLDMTIETRKHFDSQIGTMVSMKNQKYNLTSSSNSNNGNCYIATMAYGNYDHPQVLILRQFRDNVLEKSTLGKWLIKTYYHYSPKLVKKVKNKKIANAVIRKSLNQFIKLIK